LRPERPAAQAASTGARHFKPVSDLSTANRDGRNGGSDQALRQNLPLAHAFSIAPAREVQGTCFITP